MRLTISSALGALGLWSCSQSSSDAPVSVPECSGVECTSEAPVEAREALQPDAGAAPAPAAAAAPAASGAPPASAPLPASEAGASGVPVADLPPPAAVCASSSGQPALPPLALYMMLDSSGSMEEPTGSGLTKWQAVQGAIRDFLVDFQGSSISMGLQFFPLLKPGTQFTCTSHEDCGADGGPCFLSTCLLGDDITLCETQDDCPGDPAANPCVPFGLCANSDPAAPTACVLPSTCGNGLGVCQDFERTCTNATQCDATAYATPAVAIDRVDVNLDSIGAALAAQPPQGLTPTVPALEGALQQTRAWQAAHPEQTVATLLVTDGLPTDCAGNTTATNGLSPLQRVLELAEEGAAGTPSIRTFVIGVFPPDDVASARNVSAIAAAGRTGSAITVDSDGDVSAQFLQGLRSVTAAATSCRSPLEAVSGLDYTHASVVELNGNEQVQRLRFVGDRQACATAADGWFYDVPLQSGAPSAVELCPDTCARVRATPAAGVLVQVGCVP